jgi:hypothetical protein
VRNKLPFSSAALGNLHVHFQRDLRLMKLGFRANDLNIRICIKTGAMKGILIIVSNQTPGIWSEVRLR